MVKAYSGGSAVVEHGLKLASAAITNGQNCCTHPMESQYKGAKKAIFTLFVHDFLGRRGGCASSRLDHGLKTLPGRLREQPTY